MKKAPLGFQNLLRSVPSQRDQFRGCYTAFRSVSGLKGFGHGSKVFPQPAGLAGSQTKAVQGFRKIESQELGAGCSRAKRPARSRGMKSVLIMAGRNRFGYLAFHFDAEMI